MPKALSMSMQHRRQQISVGRIALFDHLPVAEEPVLHFGIVYLVPEFGLMRLSLTPANDLRMRFAEADDLVRGRNGPFLDNALFGLLDGSLDQWHQLGQLLRESLGRRCRVLPHDRENLVRLG